MRELVAQGYVELRTLAGFEQQARLTDTGRAHLEQLLADQASRGRFPRRLGLQGEEI
jgi:hypothetical protein